MRPWAAYRCLDLWGCARWAVVCLLYLALVLPAVAANPIQLENAKPGTTDWQISNLATKGEIEGFASLASVNRGGQIRFYVNTSAPTFTLEIFRLGWYGGMGGRRMTSPLTISSIQQPAPLQDSFTGLTECNWIPRYVLNVPANPSDATDWASGVYVAKLTRTDTGKQRYIIFVIRDDNRASGFLYAANFLTYQAHNNWGGKSLQESNSMGGRARKVSFNRPYAGGPADDGAGDFLGGSDYNMVRFLEREAYDVTYLSDLDLHRDPALPLSHRAVLFGGSSQYWSWQIRSNLLAAREQGVNLGFFSAGNGYWQVRLEPSTANGDPDRTITAYKQDAPAEDSFYLDSDISNDHLVAGRWRDVPLQRAEEALIGGMLDPGNVSGDVVISDASHWAFANTGLGNGAHLTGLLGHEVDRRYGASPSGTQVLAHSPYTIGSAPTQYSDVATYTTAGGAVVFASGTSRWSWALDDYNAPAKRPSVLNPGAQQITRNVLARFLGPNFRLTANPGSIAAAPGDTSIVSATLTPLGGYWGNVQLGLNGLPGGASHAFLPTSISTSGSALLAFATDPATPTGSYTLRIAGTDGAITHTATVPLQVLSRIPRAGWRLRQVDSQEIGCFNYAAIKSFDGDPSTYWQTQVCGSSPPLHPHEIDIELGATYELRGFRYLPRQDGCSTGWIKGYEFYVSNDGWVWTSVSAGTFDYGSAVLGCTGNSFSGAKSISFPAVTASYVRLRSLSEVNGLRYASMAELELLGGAAGNQPPDGAITSPSENTIVYAGDWVNLAAAGWDNDSTFPLRFNWIFGEGSGLADLGAEDPGPVQFLDPGVFDITLSVADALGAGDPTPAIRSLTVLAGSGPVGPATPAALTLFDAAVVGGNGSEGVVTLSGPAPAGTVVSLASSDPATATVPASVDLTQGVSSVTFTISTSQVAATTGVTISASASGTTQLANLTVGPATLVGLTVEPASVIGSVPVDATVTINAPAPAGGASITLASNSAAASVPAGISVPAGATSATFTILTGAVSTATQVTISASYGGGTQIATFDITPPTPSLLSLSPFTVTGGTPSRATLTLTGPAPAGGLTISLSSSDAAVVSMPGSIVVPANSTTASFFILTSPVDSNVQVLILASHAGVSKSANLTVKAATPTAVTLAPTAVIGGNPAQATVTLNGPAPNGGTVVTLTSSDAAVATVPASVKVNAGSSSANFTVSTNAVASAVQVVISAAARGVTKTATLGVNPATPSSLTVSPSTLIGGSTADATLTLTGPAPSGGAVVALTSSDPTVAAVPANVTVTAGSSSATFAVSTSPLAVAQQVTISATLAGVTQSATLDVQPASLTGVGLNPATVIGGSASEATVSLDGPAPSGGMVVTLTSSDPATASVPASVTVPANASSAAFNVATTPVSAFTQVTISGTSRGITKTTKISVKIATPSALTLNSGAVIGGTAVGATVTLNGPAPSGGAVVLLASSDATAATVPANVTVPEGATSAQFTIATIPLGTSAQVTISATYKGTTQTATLDVAAATPSALTANPLAVVGGSTADAALTFTGPAPAAGATVLLSSSDPAAAAVPASVVVSPGADTVSFSVSTAPVWAWTQVTISASYGGVTKTASITVKAAVLSALTLEPATVVGGTPSQATVTLTGPVPAGGAVIALASSDPKATVPASVTVPAGASSATFTVVTSAGSAFTQATLSATYGSISRTAKLSIKVASPSALTLNPPAVIAGSTADAFVVLNGPAPPGGTVVNLVSSDPAVAAVPASITVPAGASSAGFTVSTVTVGATAQVTISGTARGVTQSAVLEVSLPTPSALTLEPNIVTGGISLQATLTLNGPAPAGGAVVSLASNNPAAIVPASVTVPAGSATVTFAVATTTVVAYTHADISASYGGVTQTAIAGVQAPSLASLTLNPSIVIGGRTSEATVGLGGPAPAGGITLTLTSANPAIAAVPSTVTVPSGATSATFTVSTTAVRTYTQVTISVQSGSVSRTAKITVKIATPVLLSLAPSAVIGGSTSQATVILNGPAPSGGTIVRLASNNTQLATVPATVTVPAGANNATFTVSTAPVSAFTQVTLSATFSGITCTAKLSLKVVSPSAVTLNPPAVIGGSSSDATVALNGPAPAGGVVVNLASSSPAASIPASVTIPAGATTATFAVATTPVAAYTQAVISASSAGVTQTATLGIDFATPTTLTLSPTSVLGGGTSQATVTLNGPAPAQGAVLTVSASNGAATAPSNVTVPAGATSTTFTVSTTSVGAPTQVTISVSDRGFAATATLDVQPPTVTLTGLTVTPSSVTGGGTSQATVSLSGPAPAGGTVIALASSNPSAAPVPSSVTVPAGATSKVFTVFTNPVSTVKSVTISASYAGVTRTATLAVRPSTGGGGGGGGGADTM